MINKYFQNLISKASIFTHKEMGIIDSSGLVIACSQVEKVGQEIVLDKIHINNDEILITDECIQIKKIYIRNNLYLHIYINSSDLEDGKYLRLIELNISTFMEYYDIKYDKLSFIKKVIRGSIDVKDIYLASKELHISNTAKRIVFVIKTKEHEDMLAYEVVQRLYPDRNKDFVIVINNRELVLIRECSRAADYAAIENTARSILDTIQTETMLTPKIGIGTVALSLENLKKSYEEALNSLEVGLKFNPECSVFRYNKLGLGRLINQVTPDICELYLKEIPEGNIIDLFDMEDKRTINALFKCDLNVSETSRELYIHRSTLLYRIDKINRITGLNILKFEDAVTLKVSMLVKKYLDSIENGRIESPS